MEIIALNWLNTSIALLTTIYVFVCASMIFLILLQRPKQEGLGAAFGASTAGEIFGSRVTSVLQRGTVYLASSFFVLTLLLAILVQRKNSEASKAKFEEVVATTPGVPEKQPTSLQAEVPTNATPVTTPVENAIATPDSTPAVAPTAPVVPEKPAVTPENPPVTPETNPAAEGEKKDGEQ